MSEHDEIKLALLRAFWADADGRMSGACDGNDRDHACQLAQRIREALTIARRKEAGGVAAAVEHIAAAYRPKSKATVTLTAKTAERA
jgi:hypothetical protein